MAVTAPRCIDTGIDDISIRIGILLTKTHHGMKEKKDNNSFNMSIAHGYVLCFSVVDTKLSYKVLPTTKDKNQ